MSIDFTLYAQSHIVACGACAVQFDAMAMDWCRCVAKDPSPLCPSCGSCVCKQGRIAARDFWIAAPQRLLDARAAEKRRRKDASARQKPSVAKVLIVDDDEEIRMITAYALHEMGYATDTAAGPQKALELLMYDRPAVVLTDALMPGGDGRELCREIKARFPDVKVIVMTSLYTSRRYATEAHRVFQADGYLAKPIDFEHLHATLRRLLTEKAA